MASVVDSERSELVGTGILLLIAGFCLASLSGALLKWMGTDLSPLQIAWGRFVVYLAVITPVAIWRSGADMFFPSQPIIHGIRALLLLAATLLFIMAVAHMPLANAISIVYCYPFLVAVLSPFLLAERVSGIAWFGVVAGFTGVLIVMRPDPGALNPAMFFALGCGTAYALHLILTRKVAQSASPLVTAGYQGLVCLAVMTPLVPLYWQPLELWHIAGFVMMGLVNAASHCLTITAFSRARASTLAPFTYVEIIWATTFGFLMFAEIPDGLTVIGMLVIISSGVLVSQAGRIANMLNRRRRAGTRRSAKGFTLRDRQYSGY